MADDFDPAKFAAFKAQPAPADNGGFDPAKFAAFKPAEAAPSTLMDTAKSAGVNVAHGLIDAAGFPGDASNFLAKGSKIASDYIAESLGFDKGPEARGAVLPTSGGIQKAVEGATGEFYKPQTDTGKYVGAGVRAAANPMSYLGPGGPLAKAVMAGASGLGGEGAAQAAEGTGNEGLARFAGSLAAGPLAARAIKPQLAPAQQMLADRGVTQMTPGQLVGGRFKTYEDAATSAPILGDFIQSGRNRSIESFNKAVGNQALEPIGERLGARTPAGHETIAEVESKLGQAYDNLIPQLHWIPDAAFAHDLSRIRQSASSMPASNVRQLNRIIEDRLAPNRWVHQINLPQAAAPGSNTLGQPATHLWGLQGPEFKSIESELGHLAGRYGKSSDAGQQLLGDRLGDIVKAMRANLERSNPAHSDELANINQGWAMYARMRDAAANRRGSEGVFTPGDLLTAIKRGDNSVRHGSFAKGTALMQRFAEAGQKVLPSTLADSGTAKRLMTNVGAGGLAAYLSPKVLAATAAASMPYLTPSMALLNRYVRPTTGVRAGYANAGRGAGSLRPLLTTPFDDQPNPYAQ